MSINYGDTITLVKDATVRSVVLMAADSSAGGGTVDLGHHSLVVSDTLIYSGGTFTGHGMVSGVPTLNLLVTLYAWLFEAR